MHVQEHDTPPEPKRKCGTCKRCRVERREAYCFRTLPPVRMDWDEPGCEHWEYRDYETTRYYG